jgi:hypothetical protein
LSSKPDLKFKAQLDLTGEGLAALVLIAGAKCVYDRLCAAIDERHPDKAECERLAHELFDEIAKLLNQPPPSSCPAGDDPNELGGRFGQS